MLTEKERVIQNRESGLWHKWGPYLSERQWGTVREDYSADGDAWQYTNYFDAIHRTYRWGEDGIAGLSDSKQQLCFSVALWNGKDPCIKERLFGLSNPQANHGEDVKEYYYYLDNTPAHSYMKMLYKYPQNEFPYQWLIDENKKRDRFTPEFELIDTGIFDDNNYYDIFIEYAKSDPEDILIKITAGNRSEFVKELNVIPEIWFRNTWLMSKDNNKPRLFTDKKNIIHASHELLGDYKLYCDGDPEIIFCENETNVKKLFNTENGIKYFKDGIDEYIVHKNINACNPENSGTKAAINYKLTIPANDQVTICLRLSINEEYFPFQEFDIIFNNRKKEADDFYNELQPKNLSDDERNIQRQAFAGMLWNKQFYHYNVAKWLKGDPGEPKPPVERLNGRNSGWIHLNNSEIISMPDKWEYPWYASWDLAFHCIPFALLDPDFAKNQLVLLTHEWYMHPNGQLPAYEWNFSDANPPVHAWAAWRVYKIDKKRNAGNGDTAFLETVFHKLLLNFTWWVNRKDQNNLNVFQGGFLGLDNIGVFDRSAPLPDGGYTEQADATSWMAMFSLNLLRISLELSKTNPVYQNLAIKFFEHFLYIAGAMTNIGGEGINLWDEEDQFFYDVLHSPDNQLIKLKVRSMVGLIPLFAVEVLEPDLIKSSPLFEEHMEWFLNNRPDLAKLVSHWKVEGIGDRKLLSLLRGHRMKKLLARMLDETEFLSEYGIRSLSKFHEENPYTFSFSGSTQSVKYESRESENGMFGGNSNWRGPVWIQMNFLIIESLHKFHHYYGDDFKIEYPVKSGKFITIKEIASEIEKRLLRIFLKNENGRRPIFGKNKIFQTDPNFRDYILFNEYIDGDTGEGLGASHQTGWTGLISKILQH